MNRTFAAAVLGATLLVGASHSNGAVIFADNFNTENGGAGALNYTSFANWTVSSGSVDLIGNGFADFYPGNGLYVDLDGSTGDAGVLAETTALSLAAGTYTVQFALGGNARGGPSDIVTISLGSLYSEVFTLASSAPLTLYTRTVVVGSATTASLSFSNAGGDNVGAILDNVTVASVVPVPGTVALLGLGLGLLGLGRSRRRMR